ncbi:hypothetical protein [Methylobacterium sp. CM6257]
MIVLIAAALVGGLLAAVILVPVSALAALIITPLVASASAILACCLIAWRATRIDRKPSTLDTQTDAMVAALREVAQQSAIASPAPKVSAGRHRAA